MKALLLIAAFLPAVAFLPTAAHAEMYKCVDERGKVTYSDKSRAGCKQVDIQGSPPISGRVQEGSRDTAQDEAGFRRRQIAREIAEEQEKRAQEERAQRCARLRSELGRYSTGRRIIEKYTESGPVYMEDQAREQRVAQINAELRGCQ